MPNHAPGYWTASTISPILTGKGDTLLKGGVTYAQQIALERFGVVDEDSAFTGNKATEWGNLYESEAISVYEMRNIVDVYDQQVGVKDGWKSCTPDGYISDNGLLEVKAPFASKNHLLNLIENAFVSDYEDQVQFQMMLTGRQWCDLISYDPRFPDSHCLHVVRIEVDTDWQKRCMNRIEQAEEVIAETIEKLNKYKS